MSSYDRISRQHGKRLNNQDLSTAGNVQVQTSDVRTLINKIAHAGANDLTELEIKSQLARLKGRVLNPRTGKPDPADARSYFLLVSLWDHAVPVLHEPKGLATLLLRLNAALATNPVQDNWLELFKEITDRIVI